MDDAPFEALLRVERPSPGWLAFRRPLEVAQARSAKEVASCLRRAAAAVDGGAWAVGYLAYEAAPAFDDAFVTRPPAGCPVAAFGLFESAERLADIPPPAGEPARLEAWTASEGRRAHARAVARIRHLIRAGSLYQVNHTFRLEAPFTGDPATLFSTLWERQPGAFACRLRHGRRAVCSISPELFFELRGSRVVTRPMKGTAPRGRDAAEDRLLAQRLAGSAKERAENLMIVDMMRNDLGRVARPGSVAVSRLFDIERLPSVHQMTSTVQAETDASWTDVLGALFPAASITGAPKAAAMRAIRRLEPRARGVYTGTIGYAEPGGAARFSVAIRTVEVDLDAGRAAYGVGGGIVWDSRADDEYRECLAKALAVRAAEPRFDLLETLGWSPEGGFALLPRHLQRLAASADHFARPCDLEAVEHALDDAVAGASGKLRVRLRLTPEGEPVVEAKPFEPRPAPWRLALADAPVDSSDPRLAHKTTRRGVYRRAREAHPEADDVILWNERGELTETTRANLAVRTAGTWHTPPLACGLLPGVRRAELLARGRIVEARLRKDSLTADTEIAVFNSLRGWVEARLDRAADEKEPASRPALRRKEE